MKDSKSLNLKSVISDSDTALVKATAKQLGKDMEKAGKTTFTMKDLKAAQEKVFRGEG